MVKESYYKEILKLILPSLAATLFTGIYIIVDGLFIGQAMGDIGLAAMNIVWPVAAVILAIGFGVGTASGILITINQEKGKTDEVNKIITSFFLVVAFYSLLVLLLYFVKEPLLLAIGADDSTLDPAIRYLKLYLFCGVIQILSCGLTPIMRNYKHHNAAANFLVISVVINFIGDYLFMMKFGWELVGAAFASILSQAFYVIAAIIFLIKKKKLNFNWHLDFKLIGTIMLKGIAPFILNYASSLIIIFYNVFSFNYGKTEAVAAYTVVAYIIYIPQYISTGITEGIQPLITKQYALKTKKEMIYFRKSLLLSLLTLSALSILFIVLKEPVARLYNLSSEATSIYNDAFFFFTLSFPAIGISRAFISLFCALSKDAAANMLVLIEPIITPLILWMFTEFAGLKGVWISFLVIQIILVIMALMIYLISSKISKKREEMSRDS